MYYYKTDIPRHANGTIAKYPPGWHGVLARCPKNVTVLLFNDVAGYLIARVDDTFVPPEVTVLTEADALARVAAVLPAKGIYVGTKIIQERWVKEAQAQVDEMARLKAAAEAKAIQDEAAALEHAKYILSLPQSEKIEIAKVAYEKWMADLAADRAKVIATIPADGKVVVTGEVVKDG